MPQHHNPTELDLFFNKEQKWQAEMKALRTIAVSCNLTEEFKWRHPCYTFNGGNIAIIHGFKMYCAISFFKGALLSDKKNILVQQTKNVQSGRQIRGATVEEILQLKHIIKEYLNEAIEIEKQGLKVPQKTTAEFVLADELVLAFKQQPALQKAFYTLTPGRQREYLLHFSSAKQATTRIARVENCIPRILNGKGLSDCLCGLSKRMPYCDGSHKQLKK